MLQKSLVTYLRYVSFKIRSQACTTTITNNRVNSAINFTKFAVYFFTVNILHMYTSLIFFLYQLPKCLIVSSFKSTNASLTAR